MKTAWKLCLALALMVAALFVVSVPVFAAGTHTISGTVSKEVRQKETPAEGKEIIDLSGVAFDDGTVFDLYKVGGFKNVSGKSVLDLDMSVISPAIFEEYPEFSVNDLEKPEQAELIEQWQLQWLDKAKIAHKYLSSEAPKSSASMTGGEFAFSNVSDGLYLLVSNATKIVVNPDDTETLYRPLPMFVMVLNGDVRLELKVEAEPIVHHYTVNKQWKTKEGYKPVYPDSIEVDIYYNYEVGKEPEKTVTLNEGNDWTYSWESKKRGTYSVIEKITPEIEKYYVIDPEDNISVAADAMTTIITNTYNPYNLKIKKIMPDYVDHFGPDDPVISTSFVFEITGKDKDGKVAYHNYVGVQMAKGEYEQEVLVANDIPRNLASITVVEKYAGGYTPTPAEAEITLTHPNEGDTYLFEFENKYQKPPIYSGGVINRFSKGETAGNYSIEQIGLFKKKD